MIVILAGGHGAGPLAMFLVLPVFDTYHAAATFALVLHGAMIASTILWCISLLVSSVKGVVALSIAAECIFGVTVFLVACDSPPTLPITAATMIPNLALAAAFVRNAKKIRWHW